MPANRRLGLALRNDSPSETIWFWYSGWVYVRPVAGLTGRAVTKLRAKMPLVSMSSRHPSKPPLRERWTQIELARWRQAVLEDSISRVPQPVAVIRRPEESCANDASPSPLASEELASVALA